MDDKQDSSRVVGQSMGNRWVGEILYPVRDQELGDSSTSDNGQRIEKGETLLPSPLTETDLSDITNFPKNNDEFLNAVFTNLEEEEQRPFVLGFSGNPRERKAWGGTAWRNGKVKTDNVADNWYYTLAVYAPSGDGYHRREKDCVAVFGVMLDDLGPLIG